MASRKGVERVKVVTPAAKSGVVYTKPWAVGLILDLAGYVASADLVSRVAVEPAAGEGGFLVPMVKRLLASCRRQGRSWADCAGSLQAYELDAGSAQKASSAVLEVLLEAGLSSEEAEGLVGGWIRVGDYLLEAATRPGVDLVVGNPPYIRLEEVGVEAMAGYRRAYPTMKGRADLYVAFFEAGLRQLRENGVCAFICADRWMTNQYGAELRRFISEGFGVEFVVELHEVDAFEAKVAAYPSVTVLRRPGDHAGTVVARLERGVEGLPEGALGNFLVQTRAGTSVGGLEGVAAVRVGTWFGGSEPWPSVEPKYWPVLRRLEAEFRPLEDPQTGTVVGIGVASGCDRVFLTCDAGLVESSRLLPLARVEDTHGGPSGRLKWSGGYLVNPWDAAGLVDLEAYPRLKAYFETHAEVLKARHVAKRGGGGWYRTIDRVDSTLLKTKKLYIMDIGEVLRPILDLGASYPHHNLYYITSTGWDLEVLGGLLMSKVGQFFVASYGVRMRGGWLRFQAQYLRRIRVPKPEAVSASQAERLRESFRTGDRARATDVACELYGIRRDWEGLCP